MHGELELNKFEPCPKNPPISKVFREIGYADELGSGMRNTNKYTKLYSGGVPKFVEENTFEIVIPIENVPELKVGGVGTHDGTHNGTHDGTHNGTHNGTQQKIMELVAENPKITRKAMAEMLNISIRTLQRVLNETPNLHFVGVGAYGHWEIIKDVEDGKN